MAARIPASVTFDELISAGCLGLIDAVDKYDSQKNVSLKTYAQYRIKGAILDELRRMDWYSRSMRKKIQGIEKAMTEVELREGRPAQEEEVADMLGMDIEKYQKMLSEIHCAALLDLDACIKDNEGESLMRKTFQEQMRSDDDPAENLNREQLKTILAEAIRNLSEKEQIVISLYYYEELTLKEIGQVLNLTESRICQIHSAALIKMKNRLKEHFLR
jgi:RNA polymerase sigma factor for flagellar operon FliA